MTSEITCADLPEDLLERIQNAKETLDIQNRSKIIRGLLRLGLHEIFLNEQNHQDLKQIKHLFFKE